MSKLFNSILQGFKEFGEITNNKSLLNQIDEIETSETFEEGTIHKSIYTIDYVDNTGASFKDRIKASSEEDALKKFNKKSKNFVNGVRKIKGHPYIDYLDDDASYDEIDDLTEDTQLKFDGDMINDIDILYGWRPQEVERILIKHGSDKTNDNWIDGLDLPAAYDEIMSTFRDKYSDDDEIDYDAAKVLGLIDESLKESFRMSRDDFNRMCKENGILQGLSRRDYMEIRDLFHAGSESFDSAVNDLWHGDDEFHSRDWYENLLKKYTDQESLKEAKKLHAPKFWNTNFSDNVIKDYEAGKLTFNNIEEWDIAYNDGRKPNPPFNTKEILDYYLATKESFKGEDDKMKLKINEDTVKNGDFYVGWAKVNIDKFYDYMTSHPKLKIYKRGSDYYVATSEHDSYAQKVDNSIIDTLKSDPRFKKLFVESKSIKNNHFTEKDFNAYAKHTEDDVRRIALSISRMMREHDEYYELFENLIDELVDILKNDSGMFKTESLKLKESIMSTEEFLKWHDDPENYRKYRDKFYAIYDIFGEYGFSDNEDVDTEYERLSYEDQVRVTNIIKDTQTESLKLKESTNSLDDYKVYKILINALVPNSVNLARRLNPNGECYNEIVDVLRKNGLNLADAIIDYKENPELTKRLHDMGIVHGNSTIEELTDKVLKKLDDNGYDTSDRDVRNYAEAAAELIINDVNQDIDDWYSETLINYPEDLEELPKK